LKNEKVSNLHTYASRLFSDIARTNSKSGSFFNKVKDKIDIAITQEKELEQNILNMATSLGSNVGILLEQMREDPRDAL
jgi:hypothetical protein